MGIKRNDGDSGVGEYQSAELMPPSPTAELAKVLQAMKDSRRAWPGMFPDIPLDAAKFWVSKQEPCGVREGAEKIIIPKKKWNDEEVHYRFEYPYIERMKANLRMFMQEPSDSQRYIMAAVEDGVPYRGDDNQFKYWQFDGLTMFQNIVKETEIMREMGVSSYAKKTLGMVSPCVGKLTKRAGRA